MRARGLFNHGLALMRPFEFTTTHLICLILGLGLTSTKPRELLVMLDYAKFCFKLNMYRCTSPLHAQPHSSSGRNAGLVPGQLLCSLAWTHAAAHMCVYPFDKFMYTRKCLYMYLYLYGASSRACVYRHGAYTASDSRLAEFQASASRELASYLTSGPVHGTGHCT